MARLFGTDGVRGVANRDLTAEVALAVGAAAARLLGADAPSGRRPVAVVGRDPRASGEMLDAAVIAGLTSEGVDALRVGVLPTPAVAYLTSAYDADFGVMISASHNPMPDNGIKIFGPGGFKLDDATEDLIEEKITHTAARPVGARIGRVIEAEDCLDRYLRHVSKAVTARLDALTVVVDCAYGAASTAAPRAYRAAGVNVIPINADPNGLNINDGCGSTHLAGLQSAVVAHGADLGLAHDGDADRCLAVDAAGRVVDGDAIMVILALAMQEAGELASNVLVTTVMSNLGLHLAMRSAGIEVRTTGVGDRYVLEELRTGEYSLGGEQSGHIVMPAMGTTGDGIVTGLRLMSQMAHTGLPLATLAAPMQTLPQVLINVEVADKATVADAPSVRTAVAAAEQQLGDTGRILLRPSGTEQIVRVMVEAVDEDTAKQLAVQVAESVSQYS